MKKKQILLPENECAFTPDEKPVVHVISPDVSIVDAVAPIIHNLEFKLMHWTSLRALPMLLASPQVDVVLLDCRLEGDINTVCEKLSNNEDEDSVPVLLLATDEKADVMLDALRAGGDDYLRIPFQPMELLIRIRSILEMHGLRKQARKSRERNMIISKLIFCMNVGMELNDMIVPVLPDIFTHTGASAGCVILLDNEGSEDERLYPLGDTFSKELDISHAIILDMLNRMEPVQVPGDVLQHPGMATKPSACMLAIPLMEREMIHGAMVMVREDGETFEENQILSLSLICDALAISISRFRFIEEIAKAHSVMKREFTLLGRLQQLLLPKELPQIATVNFEAYYQPASEAGGDYYDVLPLTDSEVGIVIADVSGHGAPAAMNMGIARSILHTVSFSQETSPAKTLYFLNKLLCRLLGEGAYITMFYGVLNIKTYTFSWTNAGHVPALVKRVGKRESESIGDPSSGPPLGWWDTAEFDQGATQLYPGDLVLLYTDGATEAVNIHDEMFDYDQMSDFVSASPFYEPKALVHSLVEAISEHAGEVPFLDDVTILSFKINS